MPPRVIALVAAYNEADVIEPVVADLIAQGLSVHLIDHASTDGTAEAAARHLGRGLLAIERFPEESGFPAALADRFAWERLLERKEQLARSLDADWFLHTDADELREGPFVGRTLAEAIAEVDALGYDAIDFAVLNFPPTDDAFRPGDDLRARFRHYEPAQNFDRLQIKCWKKTDAIDLRSSGGHEARFPGRRVFPVRFLDRHYPVRTQAQGERKVFVERKPRFVDEERARGWHVQYDALAPGCSFLRDPATLTPFDPVAARRALFEHDRACERVEAEARRALDEEAARRRAIEAVVQECETELAARARALDEAQAQLVRADETARARGEALEEARAALQDAQRRLDEVHASPAWRWVAAGRALRLWK